MHTIIFLLMLVHSQGSRFRVQGLRFRSSCAVNCVSEASHGLQL